MYMRTSNCRNSSACACACQPKTRDRRQRRVCASGVRDDERRAARRLVYPVIDGVFGALVYGEGDGSNEGYAEEGRPDACTYC